MTELSEVIDMSSKKTGLRGSKTQAKTRVLLVLWDLGANKSEIKKGELMQRVQRTNEKVGDYQEIFQQLEQDGAIAISKNKISLFDKGVQILGEGLKNPDFQFDSQVGAKTANSLLKWMREMDTITKGAKASATSVREVESKIASYDHFKSEVHPLFEKLNQGFNYSGLVPIWHLRQELDKRVSREEFNNWLMQMQADQLFYLQSGEARGATEEQKRDSITDEVRGLLFFASKPL